MYGNFGMSDAALTGGYGMGPYGGGMPSNVIIMGSQPTPPVNHDPATNTALAQPATSAPTNPMAALTAWGAIVVALAVAYLFFSPVAL